MTDAGRRKRVIRENDSGMSMMLQMERREFHKRLSIRRHANGRPLCQYCAKYSAQYIGRKRTKDCSLMMRKFQGKYECIACHQKRLNLSPYWGAKDLVQGESY